MRHWLLPEHIEDVLPAEAAQMETVRRTLLDLFRVHGYQLVIPPMLEYVESLTSGAGHDLDIATFKVVDQLTGRLMGVRADMTPQAARIDAHLLNRQGVVRLCYAGSVLRTQPDGLAKTREPLQLGAELYGHAGVESDLEIQRLMVHGLQAVGVRALLIDFSHVGIFRALVRRSGIAGDLEQTLYQALQSKDVAMLEGLSAHLPAEVRAALVALTQLNGGIEVLTAAQSRLPQYAEIKQALQDLTRVANRLADLDIAVSFDLAELRGYHYHSGMVFAAYAQGYSGPLALGGRYDEVGALFGRTRHATGFSLDLRALMTALAPMALPAPIYADYLEDAAQHAAIVALRAAGEVVVIGLPGHDAHRAELGCYRALIEQNGNWVVVPLNQ